MTNKLIKKKNKYTALFGVKTSMSEAHMRNTNKHMEFQNLKFHHIFSALKTKDLIAFSSTHFI